MKPPPGRDPDSIVLTFPVAHEFAGQRLDRFIQARIPRLSRTRAQAIIKSCACHEDGSSRRPSDRVRAGETVLLVRPKLKEPDVPLDIRVLYEDEHVFVVDKPPGLPMHPSASYHRHTLTYQLREKYGDGYPRIAHRLDRETSGVVVCGKGVESERALKRAFERRKVSKTYLAIVRGRVEENHGDIDLPMAPVTEGLHIRMEVRDTGPGSEAHTVYEVLERKSTSTLVELRPRTGRQHQLRVHLSAKGHPIVGDKLYGPDKEKPFLSYIDGGMTAELEAWLGHPRHALHAHGIELQHPLGHELRVQSPLPDDLVHLWGRQPTI